jgi:hypothetical protein
MRTTGAAHISIHHRVRPMLTLKVIPEPLARIAAYLDGFEEQALQSLKLRPVMPSLLARSST